MLTYHLSWCPILLWSSSFCVRCRTSSSMQNISIYHRTSIISAHVYVSNVFNRQVIYDKFYHGGKFIQINIFSRQVESKSYTTYESCGFTNRHSACFSVSRLAPGTFTRICAARVFWREAERSGCMLDRDI